MILKGSVMSPMTPAVDAGKFVKLANVDGDTVLIFEKLAILIELDDLPKIAEHIDKLAN